MKMNFLNWGAFLLALGNFVWGIKVLAGINHAVETVSFTAAYTLLVEWIKFNGATQRPWYSSYYKNLANCIAVNY